MVLRSFQGRLRAGCHNFSGLHLQVQSMQSAAATSPDIALDEDAARTHQDGSKERLEEPDLPDDESLVRRSTSIE